MAIGSAMQFTSSIAPTANDAPSASKPSTSSFPVTRLPSRFPSYAATTRARRQRSRAPHRPREVGTSGSRTWRRTPSGSGAPRGSPSARATPPGSERLILIARSALSLAGEQESNLPLAHVGRFELDRDALAQGQVALTVGGYGGVGQLDAPAAVVLVHVDHDG